VVPGPLPSYTRRDKAHVSSAAQRPTDAEYDRYLWLVEEAKNAGYDAGMLRETSSFQVGDVLFTAIFAAACDLLAEIADQFGTQTEAAEVREYAVAARSAVFAGVDPETGLAADWDMRTGAPLKTETCAGFAPLICGGAPAELRRQQVELLLGPRWAGHPDLKWKLPPSTSPHSPQFDPECYWRGPVWPVFTWLLYWALRRSGDASEAAVAADLRTESLRQLEDETYAEYYHPMTGAPLGSRHQSWTAAVALDWLLDA
jgi:hypothetical protein